MRNILITGAFKANIETDTLQKMKRNGIIDNSFFVVSHIDDVEQYNQVGVCILREKAAKGKLVLEEYFEKHEIIPLDKKVLNFMSKYTLVIFSQFRRYEEYHLFTIDPSFSNFYEIYLNNMLFWYNMLVNKHITHVVMSSIPHEGYDLIIYYLCRYMDISLKMVYNCTLPGREFFLDDIEEMDKSLLEKYKSLCTEYENKNIDEIILEDEIEMLFQKWASQDGDKMKPWNMRVNPLKRRFGIRFGQLNIFREWYEILGKDFRKAGMKKGIGFMLEVIRDVPFYIKSIGIVYQRWIESRPVWKRTLKLRDYYESIANEPIDGQKYIYYAMHYQPEASSNPLGGIYAEQRLVLHILSYAVPNDVMIYVKEHPEQLAPLRSREYYSDIAAMRNVKLIKMNCNSYELVRNSIATASITGTTCWESQFFGIPALLFGYSQKNGAPLSYYVSDVQECANIIKNILGQKREIPLKQLKLYVKAMYDSSFPSEEHERYLSEMINDFVNV